MLFILYICVIILQEEQNSALSSSTVSVPGDECSKLRSECRRLSNEAKPERLRSSRCSEVVARDSEVLSRVARRPNAPCGT